MSTVLSRVRAFAAMVRARSRHNRGLKLVSLVLACLVWWSTNVLERDAERVVDVPVVPRHVPPDLTVVDAPTTPVAITLRGPRTLLEGVEESRLKFVLPVRGLRVGSNRVDLQEGHIEPDLPRRLRVVRLQPGRIELRAEPLHVRRLPVRVETIGTPAFGYSVTNSTVQPPMVAVSGPASVVDQLRRVQTVPVDIGGADREVTRLVGLEWVGDYVQFEPDRVSVTVELEEVIVSKEFRKVPVHVLGAPTAVLTPPTLAVTLRGPQRILNDFEVPADAAVVDARGLAPGSHQVEVAVTVPRGIEVVTRTPEVHRLVVPEQKGAS
ncbi:MAG TPA: CdaR family protein [Candidatus Limnocylindria bacterium]|nr:CdaR family protein [Candidatus Limnocylindria bacterium]